MIWGFPKIAGTIFGVPIMRTIVFWVLYWGPPILGNYHINLKTCASKEYGCPFCQGSQSYVWNVVDDGLYRGLPIHECMKHHIISTQKSSPLSFPQGPRAQRIGF